MATTTRKADWFAVDKEGLSALLERRGKARAVLELIQNAWDESGVTYVKVTVEPAEKRGRTLLVVEDDAPNGFADLSHAFTLFAPSKKVDDATKRGRFNLGEKLVLAICDEAAITSTTGGWRFDEGGRSSIRTKRAAGSEFRAVIRMNQDEREQAIEALNTLIPPPGISTVVNGSALLSREPKRAFVTTLRTELADAEGILRPTRRQAEVRLFSPLADEQPHLYELGIPVVETDLPWHVDIGQKVPLNLERDNVTPAYNRELQVAVLNQTAGELTPEQATATWVKAAASDDRVTEDAVRSVVRARFGDMVVAFDPSDQQANAEATLKGYTVIGGRTLSKDEWKQVKRAGCIKPAGQVTPSNSTVELSPDGLPPIPESDWTPGMQRVATYAQALAAELMGMHIRVEVHRSMQNFLAAYGGGKLSFNLQHLGHRWFNDPQQHRVDELLLHEFAHQQVANHLSEDYHAELCRLGAKMRGVTITV